LQRDGGATQRTASIDGTPPSKPKAPRHTRHADNVIHCLSHAGMKSADGATIHCLALATWSCQNCNKIKQTHDRYRSAARSPKGTHLDISIVSQAYEIPNNNKKTSFLPLGRAFLFLGLAAAGAAFEALAAAATAAAAAAACCCCCCCCCKYACCCWRCCCWNAISCCCVYCRWPGSNGTPAR
jgi:hypothetical protein